MAAGPNQASQHSSRDEGGARDPPIPLAEDIDSEWLLEGGQFLLKCGPWCTDPSPVDGSTPMCVCELKSKVGREGMRRES